MPETSPSFGDKNQIVRSANNQSESPHREDDEYDKPEGEWKDRSRPQVKLNKAEWIAVFTLVAIFAQNILLYRTLGEIEKTTKATEVQARANVDQLPLMKDSIDVARKAIEQNNVLIESAQKQANASLTQANVSQRMAQQNEDLVKSAQVQANTSQVSAKAAERSAQLAAESQRPNVEIAEVKLTNVELGKNPSGKVGFRNSGFNPARNFTAQAVIAFASETRLEDAVRHASAATKATVIVLGRGSPPVNVTAILDYTFKPEDIVLLEQRVGFVYFYVVGSYEDWLTRTRVDFEHCWRYDVKNPTEVPFCTTHNTVKETRY